MKEHLLKSIDKFQSETVDKAQADLEKKQEFVDTMKELVALIDKYPDIARMIELLDKVRYSVYS